MVVLRCLYDEVIAKLEKERFLSLDCETTGLRPYHGDRLFSVIIASQEQTFYFNFQDYGQMLPDAILLREQLQGLKRLLSDKTKTWFLHNAKFDLAFLWQEGLEILGTVHDTQAIERVVYNDHPPGSYDLDACAKRIGFEKDQTVERVLERDKLWTWSGPEKPGAREKRKHYDQVPFDIIVPYGERDAYITYCLAEHQKAALEALDYDENSKLPPVQNVAENERRLTHTLFRMERVGVQVDIEYCLRAARYEDSRADAARSEFRKNTGRDFSASGKLFQEIFREEQSKWIYTEKKNPSFTPEALSTFEHPAASNILEYRGAKSRSDYYKGFIYHADGSGAIHPHWNQAGTATGRMSSSGPNFQNLTSEEGGELEQEFVVRRAIIPRPGFVLYGRDYNCMEYRLFFDRACGLVGHRTPLAKEILGGKDPHQATADLVTAQGRIKLTRGIAKNGNFAQLYGSGLATLAKTIGGTEQEAKTLREALREAAPEVSYFTQQVSKKIRSRGYVTNFAGRRSYLKDMDLSYKMTNYLIQGGCADVVKFAMNQIDEFLLDKKSRMILTIHDELCVELHESEMDTVPARVKEIMESIYQGLFLQLPSAGYIGRKNLADLEDAL